VGEARDPMSVRRIRYPRGFDVAGPRRLFNRHAHVDTPAATWAIRITTLAVLLSFWWWTASHTSKALLVPPVDVALAFWDLAVTHPLIWGAMYQSLGTLVLGLILTLPFGIAIGLLMGRYRTAEFVLDPYVTFLFVLPNIALIPLFVLWFGFEIQLRLALVFFSGVFPLIINTMAGVKNVDVELIDSARSFCANERQIMRTVILPAAVPFIFAGIRLGFSGAWLGVIAAEITSIVSGMGGLIVDFSTSFNTARMIVPILLIMAVGITVTFGMARLERRLAPWRASER